MKLHIVSPYFENSGGGIFTVLKNLYSGEYFKTIFAEIYFWGYTTNEIEIRELGHSVFVYDVKFNKFNKVKYSSSLKKDMFNFINDGDVVHIHSMWLYLSFITSSLKKKKNIKLIISPHGMLDIWAINNGYFKKKIIYYLFEKSNLVNSDCIHVLCQNEYLSVKNLGLNNKIALIPNGVNISYLPDFHDFKKKSNKLLYFGRIHPKKGLDILINAWCEINPLDWELVIAGIDENNYESSLKQIVKNKKNINNINFVGPLYNDEKANIFKESKALILPSLSEGLPMVVLEAWSYGVPVLITPQCNLSDGFEFNAAIEILPNIESVKNGIHKLIGMDINDLYNVGYNGYNLVMQKYTWSNSKKMFIMLYNWLINENSQIPNFIINKKNEIE